MTPSDDPTPPDLAALLAELPEEIEPENDLWDAVRDEIAPVPLGSSTRWAWGAALATAAVALLVVGALAGRRSVRPAPAVPAASPVAEMDGWESDVRETTRQLMAVVDSRRDTLDPEAVAVIEAALTEIDMAIEDVRRALREDPGNGQLEDALAEVYQRKVHLLRSAAELEAGG